MASVNLEVQLLAARGDFAGAASLIRSIAESPNLNPAALVQLAGGAERIGDRDDYKLAEELYRKYAFGPGASVVPNKLGWVQFLARRKRFDEVLGLCEDLRKNDADRERVNLLCIGIFSDPENNPKQQLNVQIKRVIGWLEADQTPPQSPRYQKYQIGLGNLYENLGEDRKAMEYYLKVATTNDRDGFASNNLAWLMALDGDWKDALPHINRAIESKGRVPNPNLANFLDTRGVVWVSARDGQRAIADLEAAIKAQPTAPKFFHLAQAYLIQNDREKAKKTLETAMSQGLPKGLHPREKPKFDELRAELGMP